MDFTVAAVVGEESYVAFLLISIVSDPIISVVIATHNRANLLPVAVYSILEQTFQDFEIIVVDDCSTDDTPSIVKQLCRVDSRIHSVRLQQNSGPGVARNAGIAKAKGELIAILDDDDKSVPHRLQLQFEVLQRNPEVDVVFSPVQWVDEDQQLMDIFPGKAAYGTFPTEPHAVFKLLYLESNKIPNTTLCFRRSLFTKGKVVDGKLRRFSYPPEPYVGEDWLLFLQLSATGVRMTTGKTPLVFARHGRVHRSLMKKTEYAYRSQRQILSMIQAWLQSEKITDFDDLHSRAISNQLTREARGWGGRLGAKLYLQAWFYAPFNPFIYQSILHLARNSVNRLWLTPHTS